jgi:DNA-binding FadR family transcriptional regulator
MPRRVDDPDKWLERLRLDGDARAASSADACADALRRAILSGAVAPGVRLPPERDLAAHLAVNRSTLRSALARLATERLVRIRQGSGCVVGDYRTEAGPEILQVIAGLGATGEVEREVAADLLYVRRHLARGVLERMPKRVPLPTRVRLEAEVERLARLVDAKADPVSVAEQDVAVISTIVAATKSRVMQLCLNPLLDFARTMPRLREAVYTDASKSVAAYRAILAWLATPRRLAPTAILAALEARDRETLRRFGRLTSTARARPAKRRGA